MTLIAHASDTHGFARIVKSVGECSQQDNMVILLTGDILANRGRKPSIYPGWDTWGQNRISPTAEVRYQRTWFRRKAKRWAVAFRGRPVVYVPGNHDFIPIEPWLTYYGHTNIHTISADKPFVDVCGLRFAGFREIPYMDGEWAGEIPKTHFGPLIERALQCNPDILVTHAPPEGFPRADPDYIIPGVMEALASRQHKVTHHFFGHDHETGGRGYEKDGVFYYNGATRMTYHQIGD